MGEMSPRLATTTRNADELDQATLSRAQRGEQSAQAEFIARYQRRVFALLSRMLVNRGHLVEDLAQETFLRALSALKRFEVNGPSRLSTWLLTIATRLALDELRRRGEPANEAELLRLVDPRSNDPLNAVLVRNVERAARGLSPDHRAIVLLREAHGFSYEELAEVLELDVGTVKSRLSRARDALRAALEDP